MIWDETAIKDLHHAADNTMRSKTSDFGSGCSADGNVIIHDSIWDESIKALQEVGGYVMTEEEQDKMRHAMWDEEIHRLSDTVALSALDMAKKAGFEVPETTRFLIASHNTGVYESGEAGIWAREKLSTVLAVHKYSGEFQNAIDAIMEAGLLYTPSKASNAGGVAVSALEMSQNSMRFYWTFEEVDEKLKGIMSDLYKNVSAAAAEYGTPGNLMAGANIAGFLKVADSMLAYGLV